MPSDIGRSTPTVSIVISLTESTVDVRFSLDRLARVRPRNKSQDYLLKAAGTLRGPENVAYADTSTTTLIYTE